MKTLKNISFGSLFAGIGGFDLAFEGAGFVCDWQVEIDKQCKQVLQRHFPNAKRYSDFIQCYTRLPSVDVLVGGDPCPKHSKARSNGKSKSPDLSGYFLALAGRLRPEWVVRENVPAPTVNHFEAALAYLGYGTIIIHTNASGVTRQSRHRTFVVGQYQKSRTMLRETFSDFQDGPWPAKKGFEEREIIACLTTHRCRYDSRDNYIYESQGLRIMDSEERTAFAGFPKGWLDGFSETACAKMSGNTIVPGCAYPIAERIFKACQQ